VLYDLLLDLLLFDEIGNGIVNELIQLQHVVQVHLIVVMVYLVDEMRYVIMVQ
jgi:hypothetical protein